MMIKRRQWLVGTLGATLSSVWLMGCGGSEGLAASPTDSSELSNRYQRHTLASTPAQADASSSELTAFDRRDEFINAWGIAIRPAGAGGHFWVGAGGYSYQFLGDVHQSSDITLRLLKQDALTLVRIPGAGLVEGETAVTDPQQFEGFTTGVVFNGAPLTSDRFVVRNQPVEVNGQRLSLTGSARFLFATDSGVISGWTERNPVDGAIVRQNGNAVALIDGRAQGHSYFGLALKPGTWDRLWAADFGTRPQIRAWDAELQPVALGSAFANPFIVPRTQPVPGDFVPFNIQVVSRRGSNWVVVTYAKSKARSEDASAFDAGEEDALDAANEGLRPDRGRVAIFDVEGRLVLRIKDAQVLNAPWGIALAPPKFGAVSGCLLIGNFGGHGRIAAFDWDSGRFVDFLRGPTGELVEIAGLWGLQFGNGVSLGDTEALYFSAGPDDESQGVFGSLRHRP